MDERHEIDSVLIDGIDADGRMGLMTDIDNRQSTNTSTLTATALSKP
jgi:hypothetical protein